MDREKKRRKAFARRHKLFFKKNGAEWIAPYVNRRLLERRKEK